MTGEPSPLIPFTAHNIALSDGRWTSPERPVIEEGGICRASLRTLGTVFRRDEIPDTTIVDLGCLEGGYSVAFARAGYRTTGIEVRDLNIERCRFVEADLRLDNLQFIQDDARNLADHGTFDAVFCCGLFYHLDHPRAFLELVSQCTRQVLILQTHVATNQIPKNYTGLLSAITTHEGNEGRWFEEFPEQSTPADMESAVWSSWGNSRSFWIEKRQLIENLRAVGFDCVYEQFDFLDDVVGSSYWEDEGRTMFVALKTS